MSSRGGSAFGARLPDGQGKTKIIIAVIILSMAVFACGADTKSADAKKAKHNYKTASFFDVSGDQTSADATVSKSQYGTTFYYFYKKIAVPGLKTSDPLPLRLFAKGSSSFGYGEGSWVGKSNFSITDGYLWIQYGSRQGELQYGLFDTGDYRLFTYYGGKSTKKTKRQCAQIYNVSISGNAGNADASIVPYSYIPGTTFHYRKIPVKGLKTTSLPDYQMYKKDTFDPGLEGESWAASGPSFFTDGYFWVAYGYSSGGQYYNLNEGDFRLCLPEKVARSKNHAKRYTFSVSGDASNADAVRTYGTSYTYTYYYRKVSIPSVKMDNQPNIRLVRKSNFVSGFSQESWSGSSYYTSDGVLYIQYAYQITTPSGGNTYYETGIGDYRLFVYK